MSRRAARFASWYGAGPLHLLTVIASLAFAVYVIGVVGLAALWDPHVWWQSIVVWFLGAVILHDLVLFPAYALLDRLLLRAPGAGARTRQRWRIPPLNHLRVPALASGLLFLLFFPGIIEQGASSYLRATGQTQAPFLQRWLLLTAVVFAASAVVYAVRLGAARKQAPPAAPPTDAGGGEPEAWTGQ